MVDTLAQSLWYAHLMTDVTVRPESWFEWQTRLVWYTGLCETERADWRGVARAMMALMSSCDQGEILK